MNRNGYTPIAIDTHTSSPSPSSPYPSVVNYIWSCRAIKSCFSNDLPRVVDRIFNRGETFSQSTGEINIHRNIDRKISTHIYRLDWFHTIVDYSTPKCLVILIAFYAAEIILFATIFYVIYLQCGCGFEFNSYFEAIIFTLGAITSTTYSVRNTYFDDCFIVVISIFVMTAAKIVSDAITIGIIYARIARPTSRATSVIFSRYALIKEVDNKIYFMVQLCELRKHQLIEAHVRLYLIKSDNEETTGSTMFKTSQMSTKNPSDGTGGMVLLMLPQAIVHEIDDKSPLNGFESCDEEFDAESRETSRDRIKRHLADSNIEILAIVEGTDSTSGGVVQARHSYLSRDILWNHNFSPCVSKAADGFAVIDFDSFHNVEIEQTRGFN